MLRMSPSWTSTVVMSLGFPSVKSMVRMVSELLQAKRQKERNVKMMNIPVFFMMTPFLNYTHIYKLMLGAVIQGILNESIQFDRKGLKST